MLIPVFLRLSPIEQTKEHPNQGKKQSIPRCPSPCALWTKASWHLKEDNLGSGKHHNSLLSRRYSHPKEKVVFKDNICIIINSFYHGYGIIMGRCQMSVKMAQPGEGSAAQSAHPKVWPIETFGFFLNTECVPRRVQGTWAMQLNSMPKEDGAPQQLR